MSAGELMIKCPLCDVYHQNNHPHICVGETGTKYFSNDTEISRLRSLLKEVKEDAERLSQSFIEQNNICVHCGSVVCTEFGYYEQLHTDDCPITLHNKLISELEKREG